jgi:hypothetical protein
VLAWAAVGLAAEDVPPPSEPGEKPAKGVAENVEQPVEFRNPMPPDPAKLRKEYPFRSLKPRLEYERTRRSASVKPKLTEAATEHLARIEDGMGFPEMRGESLRLLHSDQVEKFVKAAGFGFSRMRGPEASPDYLPPAGSTPLPLARVPESGEDKGPAIELPEIDVVEDRPDAWLPSKRDLLFFQDQSQQLFASPWNFGYVKSLDKVAGFEPHAFLSKPELHHPDAERDEKMTHRWEISRLELVSLLKHDEPRVYLSKNLPRMQDLDARTTRKLDKFETAALEQLRAGEDLQTQAETNTIHMMGSLRAAKQCVECHQVKRGDLLGAFSYELKRTPPVSVPKRRAI